MKRRTRKSVLKSCMDSEEREVGVNSVGDGQDREWVEESQRDWKCSLKHGSCTGSVKAR